MALIDDYQLADRYRLDDGRVFVSGSQALARVPLEQLRADRRAGLHTAAFVSGYPGSPLANYDRDARDAAALAAADGFTFVAQPGLNEELAATAVMGSQLAATLDSRRFDGVIGIWFGKAPGLDRASDALRHAVFAGTSAHGGAVAIVGDDPRAKSSTLPSSSDATLADLRIPVLYPGDVQEAVDLGRHAIALSRACGLWSALKVVDAVADGTGTVELGIDRIRPVVPHIEVDGVRFVPRPSGALITPFTLDLEREFHEVRLVLAERYGVENRLNHVTVRGADDWLGIVATGHTSHEVVEALRLLGLPDPDALRAAGIRLLHLGMPVPLDPATVREFATGLTEVVVVEEKGPTLERLVKDALYAVADRPVVTGKESPDGSRLVPSTGTLDADTIAPLLRRRLLQRLSPDRLAPSPPAPRQLIPLTVNRTPYFCSGCPHNLSTRAPEGALVGAGIGCHSMVMLMDPERTGPIVGLTAMGNEGAQWIGMAPFVDDHHLVQNIGDGTLFHSGLLAVRAAAASGVDITYKILYNGAVAMTGGQQAHGGLDVPALCRALLAEGVRQIIVTTDDLDRYRDIELPPGVKLWGRHRLIEAQELLATVAGCTVLVHDQRCAAEKRRDRKRGRIASPAHRVVINERVCEGCGDCGDVSNCLSVQPVDTPFGRKTRIDQHSCNLDLSCVGGDCPSFATVVPARRRARAEPRRSTPPTDLPDPPAVEVDELTVRMSGIGGTGVVTVSQIVGTAAMLGGLHVRGLDQTGLSQKAGPVVSDLRLSTRAPRASNKAPARSVDLLLAFDQLVAGSDAQLGASASDRTVVVANSATTATGSMVTRPEIAYPDAVVTGRLDASSRHQIRVDALGLVQGLLGDAATANVLLLGVAAQLGHLPLHPDLLERAITLNGVAVADNLAAFAWGRAWAADPAATERIAGLAPTDDTTDESVAQLVDRLADDLRAYQSGRLETRYREVVDRVAEAGHDRLTAAVARHLHRLMAYKDEYEVARLLLLPESRAAAEGVAGPGARVQWHLHPPMLRSLGMRRKIRLGRWAAPLLWSLRSARRLRGTPFDAFGWARVRRVERAMVGEYVAAVDAVLAALTPDPAAHHLDEAVAIAELPDRVRGYEHLKLERAEAYRAELRRRVAAFSG